MAEAVAPQVGIRQNRGFVLGSLSFGHGISHLYDLGFPLILREIAAVFGYSNFTVAILFSIRQAGSSVVNLGGGPLVDMLKDKWGLILTGCMAWSALTFIIMGASPNLPVLALAVLLVSVPGSLWHLPAAAALSQRFPDRRGFAITIHGTVANICNYLGPLLAAALLTVLLWRHVLFIYALPAALMAVFVWWSLRDVGSSGDDGEEPKKLLPQLRHSLTAVKNPVVMALVLAATLRGIGLSAVAHWTPFYLIGVEDDMGVLDTASSLGMGKIEAGLHLGLLAGMGVISGPILGPLSDKIGRKDGHGAWFHCRGSVVAAGGEDRGQSTPAAGVCGHGAFQLCAAPHPAGISAGHRGQRHGGHGYWPGVWTGRPGRDRHPVPGLRGDNQAPWGLRLNLLLLGNPDADSRRHSAVDASTP